MMNFITKPRKAFNDFLYDSSKNIKDRSFMVFSVSIILALYLAVPCGLIMKEPLSATISTLVGAVLFSIYVYISYKKQKLRTARIVLAYVVTFLFLPAMFFTNGGVGGGAPVWILLGAYYLVMILGGKFRIIMSLLNVVIMLACWIVGYHYPEYVTQYDVWGNYFDTYVSFVLVGLVLTSIITFQTRLYQRECAISEEKTKEVEEMNKAQSRFFSSMSHEIRTPINTVLGLNEIILRQDDISDEVRKDARNIQGAGKLLLALINDILDISKIEAGKMDIVPVDYNVSSLLSEVVNMIWLKAEEKGLKFEVDVDPGVPETLFGDEVRIKQILINLLNNAVKYTHEGSVGLHLECEETDDGKALITVTISDTGMGIKPDALPHLFDTFKRVDEEKNRYIEGTGLGLSIVKQLVELMGGEIKVDSVYSQGSTFMVTLKQGISSDKRIGDINIASAGGYARSDKFEHSFHAPKARILIVDDNEMNLHVEKKLLDGTGMAVDLAMSGREALESTLHVRYDVIFMDHLMPEMDGIECLRKIREQRGGMNLNVPVIVLTANAGGENIELYNSAGFDGYLLKPVSGRQLEEMLLTHLPAEKVVGNGGEEMTGSSMSTASRYAKKKAVAVAAGSMSDLPQNVLHDLQIGILPSKVYTDKGVFLDSVELDSEELVRYMGAELKPVSSDAPTVEEYIDFFAATLKKAHHLIYITLTSGSSNEYERAVKAAEAFENVTVINSELLSGSTGILVMIAAKLAQQNYPVEKIVSEIEAAKERIRCSFVIKSTDVMARRQRIGSFTNGLMNTLWLRPMLTMKHNKLVVGRFFMGSERRCYEKYIKYALPARVKPDKSFAFVTYVGMEEEDLLWIEEKVKERGGFKNIVFKTASAGIASNCGAGTFGILYMTEGEPAYSFGSLFEEKVEEEVLSKDDKEYNGVKEESAEEISEPEPAEETEAKWYEKLEGIDAAAAIKSSGSEEVLQSVLRMFYESYDARSEEIKGYFDAKDWENYTIKVHALKSSSRLVGALKLGNDAEALEMAGKNSDIDFINENHDNLMEEYRAIRDELAPILGAGDNLPEIPADVLEDAYGGLSEFAQTKEYELARMVMTSVREYSLPKEHDERFQRIQTCLSAMDWDGIIEILNEVL